MTESAQHSWWPTHEQLDNARWHERATRRHVMKIGAGVAAVAATGVTMAHAAAQDASTPDASASSPGVCVLTPELTEGPYYLDDLLVRDDITEGKAGVPMALTITVVDASTCAPIENAAVDVWHCDARGFYSGFVDANPGGGGAYVDDGSDPNTFLRGVLLSDASGQVTFKTIYPGWYAGRTIHIHMKVHVGGATADGTYDGGTTAHTGQLAFDDAVTEKVAAIDPYATRNSTFLRLAEDGVFRGIEDDDPAYVLDLAALDDADLSKGITASITVGIDPSANNGDGGGGPGSGMPPRS